MTTINPNEDSFSELESQLHDFSPETAAGSPESFGAFPPAAFAGIPSESELSRLAGLADEAILAQCDPEMRPCYEAAFQLRDETDGLFNPRWKGPKALDLGAIAKGFAVDLAAQSTYVDGNDALIDLGGNLKALRSEGGSHQPWRRQFRGHIPARTAP